MVEFQVVDKSSFIFKTDLPSSSCNIHPSGVLHAFRFSLPVSKAKKSDDGVNNGDEGNDDISDGAIAGAEEHTFAWIENTLHAENAPNLLKKRGFCRRNRSIVFIPYSTRAN